MYVIDSLHVMKISHAINQGCMCAHGKRNGGQTNCITATSASDMEILGKI